MSPKRTDEISIKLRHEAKTIYESLPKKGKGEWVSDAIVDKHEHDTGTGLQQRVEVLERKVERLEGRKKV